MNESVLDIFIRNSKEWAKEWPFEPMIGKCDIIFPIFKNKKKGVKNGRRSQSKG